MDAFAENPTQALRRLLGGRFYAGVHNMTDPDELLLYWADSFERDSEFRHALDQSLAELIRHDWGLLAGADLPTGPSLARYWERLFIVIAGLPDATASGLELFERFEGRVSFLGPLSTSRSRDPLGRFLLAVSRHQSDRRLAREWFRICSLESGIPLFHGAYGVHGVRGLPALDQSDSGRFRHEIGVALQRLASGLERLVQERSLSASMAEAEFLSTARLTVAAYPFHDRWRAFADDLDNTDLVRRWWAKAVPPQKPRRRGSPPRVVRTRPRPAGDWGRVVPEIASRLAQRKADALLRAEQVVAEQRAYAERSGDFDTISRTLTFFATRAVEGAPQRAFQWAAESTEWSPWNAIAWTVYVNSALRVNGVPQALPLALEAAERFPQDSGPQNLLGHVLMRARRLVEAKAQYTSSMTWFPEDPHAWGGLGEVNKHLRDLDSAERVYASALEAFPGNTVLMLGLAAVIRLQGHRAPEAQSIVRDVLKAEPWNTRAKGELERTQEAEWLHAVAEGGQEGSPLDPRIEALDTVTHVRFLRRWTQFVEEEERTQLREQAHVHLAEARAEDRALVAAEDALLTLEEEGPEAAITSTHAALRVLPGATKVQYALARALRSEGATTTVPLYSAEREVRLLRPLEAMAQQGKDVRSLTSLAAFRAVAHMHDGSAWAESATLRLRDLDTRLSVAKGADEFGRWWTEQVRRTLQADAPGLELDNSVDNARVNVVLLNDLEEQFVNRVVRVPPRGAGRGLVVAS